MKYTEAFMELIQGAKTGKSSENLERDGGRLILELVCNPEVEDALKDFEELGKGKDGLEKQKQLLANCSTRISCTSISLRLTTRNLK